MRWCSSGWATFYELFYDDAVLVSRELAADADLAGPKASRCRCAGSPTMRRRVTCEKLLPQGYKIALCEADGGDPKTTPKTIVRREVTRVLTPGTALDATLGAEQSNWLAALHVAPGLAGLALLDLSTGEMRATEFAGADATLQVMDEVGRARPVELLYAAGDADFDGRCRVRAARRHWAEPHVRESGR